MLQNLGGTFNMSSNPNLTGITHTASTQVFTSYRASNCNIIGNHDVSMLQNLGVLFNVGTNQNLTGITHPASTQVFTTYQANTCNITGNHDVSMLQNLGGTFNVSTNPNLTGITHTASTQVLTAYQANSCNIIGNHDISMLQNIGGTINMNSNPNLTGVTHPPSGLINGYDIQFCNITGTFDLSTLTLKRRLRMNSSPNATDIIFTSTTEVFLNVSSGFGNAAFSLYGCNLGYINFNPLSGITMDTGSTHGASIQLHNNSMTAAEVNHILYDLDNITTSNLSGWAGVLLDISGTNAAPDGSSGGYNGTASTINLIANGWSVTTS
jgi:hypothetical protein